MGDTEEGGRGHGIDAGSNTVFVRNLAYDTTDEQLVQRFENVGPVQKGFIVKDKVGKSRGFGFVKFALEEDARAAVEILRGAKLNGRPMVVDVALRKGAVGEEEVKEKVREQRRSAAGPRQRSEKVEVAAKTIVVWGAPPKTTEAELRRTIRNTKGVGEIDTVRMHVPLNTLANGATESVCLVTMREINDTKLAAPLLSGKKTHGAPIQCRRQIALATTAKAQRRCRVIIRNLPFAADADLLRREFAALGPIDSVHVPTTDDGKGGQRGRGFGFVQYRVRADAAKAIRVVTGRKVGPRAVVVDWALEKGDYESVKAAAVAGGAGKGEEGEDEAARAAEERVSKALEGAIAAEGEDEDEDEDEGEGEGEGEDEGEGEGEDASSDAASVEPARSTGAGSASARTDRTASDVLEGRTLFLRNVSIDSTEKSIFERMRAFGTIAYVKLVRDPNSAAPHKGSAFVKFARRSSADDALRFGSSGVGQAPLPSAAPGSKAMATALAADVGGVVIDGRKVVVTRAVDREAASKLMEGSKKKRVDRRHLYLAKEGNVKAQSVAAEHMPPGDLAKRQRAMRDKRTKLRNPLFFVSPLRLSVRNLSAAVTEGELRDLFHKACRAGLRDELVRADELAEELQPAEARPPVKVVRAQIAREAGPGASAAAGRSKGFGFVEFSEHLHALAALRYANNNPEYTPYAVGGMTVRAAPAGRASAGRSPPSRVRGRARTRASRRTRGRGSSSSSLSRTTRRCAGRRSGTRGTGPPRASRSSRRTTCPQWRRAAEQTAPAASRPRRL